jgi:hypothetical protein
MVSDMSAILDPELLWSHLFTCIYNYFCEHLSSQIIMILGWSYGLIVTDTG